MITIPETHRLFTRFLAEREIMVSEGKVIEALDDAFNTVYYGWKPEEYMRCTPETDRQFWVGFYRYVFEKLELIRHLDQEVAHRLCHELYEYYISPEHYILFDDVLPVLQELSARGLKLAVISNFAPTLEKILEDKGVAGYFDPIVVSTLAGYEKPDPDIFRYTLRISGMEPSEVLYVGDHETNDVWAPAQAGIDAVRIKRYAYQQGEGITTLCALLDI